MGDKILVRPVAPADVEPLIALRMASDHAARGDSPIAEVDMMRMRRYLTQADAFGLVAQSDSEPVGFTLAMDGREIDGEGDVIPGLCHIAAVFVAPAHWNRGIGKHLLGALLDAARKRNFVRAQLWTQHDNDIAKRLYARLEFNTAGREKFDERGDRLLLMSRTL